MISRRRTASGIVLAVGVFALAGAAPAAAHPLGNFSVNHAHALTISPSGIIDRAVVDYAEIPTAQAAGAVDADGDGNASADELARYGQQQCSALREAMTLSVDDTTVAVDISATSFVQQPGQAGLPTGRLECTFGADVEISARSSVGLVDRFEGDRVGWHEIIAVGDGVTLIDPVAPAISPTDGLRVYPTDLLSSPLDVRAVELTVEPGGDAAPLVTDDATSSGGAPLLRGGPFADAVDRISSEFDELVGARDLTLQVGLLAVALAMILGASHALLPGHGKTVMAAYIAGRQGSVRDAVIVGATVTGTHTGGVLLLGLALTLSTSLAGEAVIGWLGLASGLIITVLGASLLWGAIRHRPIAHGHHHGHHRHDHDHDHPHPHDHHDHPHPHPHPHDHHDHPHPHDHPHERPVSRRGLIGMGVAGGLVPSPSALIVLLSAIALGRTAFGVLLVIGYGVGMAGTLTLAGLVLVRVRDRYRARRLAGPAQRAARRWTALAPFATATLIVVVGVGVAFRAVTQI